MAAALWSEKPVSGYTKQVPALTFTEARSMVLRIVRDRRQLPAVESIPLAEASGRVLAMDARADRNYPPFNRATRDGFALRSTDLDAEGVKPRLRIVGEVRAGSTFSGMVNPGEAVAIMTGAPVPNGADAVVMIEHCTVYDDRTMETDRAPAWGANVAPAGCEARAGAVIFQSGVRLDYTHIAWLATIGQSVVQVYRRPRVAIIATGDELVPVEDTPGPGQIRNSNAYALAAQVQRAGGHPVILPIASDDQEVTARLIREGLDADLLLLSGGVSAGKYDLVEPALKEFGAEFHFDRVLIQPGQPLVFGEARNKFFFGLPGNPASTMITFELFARAAIDLVSGASEAPLQMTLARLTRRFTHKPGLTRFLPAVVSCTEVTPVDWQGSGDVPSMCRANAYLVANPEQTEYEAGDLIPVLPK